jgi:hypothetical protein
MSKLEGTCIHFPDDPNAVCSICKPKPVVDAWEAVPVVARYPGECLTCHASIQIGDVIVQGRDGGWSHEDCRARG